MFMRITWGRVAPGRWNEFETVFKKSLTRPLPKGMKSRWLVRDKKERDVGYTVTVWDSEAALETYAKSGQREQVVAQLKPFFVDQYTVTDCEVRNAETA